MNFILYIVPYFLHLNLQVSMHVQKKWLHVYYLICNVTFHINKVVVFYVSLDLFLFIISDFQTIFLLEIEDKSHTVIVTYVYRP